MAEPVEPAPPAGEPAAADPPALLAAALVLVLVLVVVLGVPLDAVEFDGLLLQAVITSATMPVAATAWTVFFTTPPVFADDSDSDAVTDAGRRVVPDADERLVPVEIMRLTTPSPSAGPKRYGAVM